MGWKDLFGKKKSKDGPGIADLTLPNLGVGYFLDYDMKTWCVEARSYYDWGSGDHSDEWQLVCHDDTVYLERESDDEDHWSISRKISIGKLGVDIKSHVSENDDPPAEISVDGTIYYLDEMGGGQFYKNGKSPGRDVLKWDYVDDSGKHYLTIEQWGETDFEAALGHSVEEYHFDNILPSGKEEI